MSKLLPLTKEVTLTPATAGDPPAVVVAHEFGYVERMRAMAWLGTIFQRIGREEFTLVDVLMFGGEELARMTAQGTNKSLQFLESLPDGDVQLLTEAVIEVNRDFFIRKATEILTGMTAALLRTPSSPTTT
jgi:hypothetical protein